MTWIEPESAARKAPAPNFSLPLPDGQTITRAQFSRNKHLVLVFVPEPDADEARALIMTLSAKHDEFTLANAVVYVISPRPALTPIPLPVLLDENSATRARYVALLPGVHQPTAAMIMILNRYGVAEFAALAPFAAETITQQIITNVWSLEYQCSL